jgi:hypothetical protein
MKFKVEFLVSIFVLNGIYSNVFAQKQVVTINQKQNPDNSIELSCSKEVPGSMFLYLDFLNITNCAVTNYKTVIKGYSGNLLRLEPISKEQSIGFSLQYHYIMGEPNPEVDSLFHYVLPFKKGSKHKIIGVSNLGESYVIISKTADTLCSMRKGTVIKIDDQYHKKSSVEKVYGSNRNSITIEHSDGTLAIYHGFIKTGIFVKLGQTVYPQTELGVMELFDTDEYRADVSISYLIDKNFKNIDIKTMQNYKVKYDYVTPYFVTDNGVEKLVSNKEYVSICTEKELLEEFTRSEKKKYLKNPTLFK